MAYSVYTDDGKEIACCPTIEAAIAAYRLYYGENPPDPRTCSPEVKKRLRLTK